MINTRDLHGQAMGSANQAFAARRSGDLENAEHLFRQAYALEAEAASQVEPI